MKEVTFESLIRPGKEMIILVGVPASGKTTVSKKLTDIGFTRISADQVRLEAYGSEDIQGDGNYVFHIVRQRTLEALEAHQPIVIDNTNIKSKYRQEFINLAKRYLYNVQLWVMDVPLGTAIERNAHRMRVVPVSVIASMHQGLTSGNIYGPHVRIQNIEGLKFFKTQGIRIGAPNVQAVRS